MLSNFSYKYCYKNNSFSRINFYFKLKGSRVKMSKIIVLGCLCLIIAYLDNVNAQARPRNPPQPSRQVKRRPPERVLNQVLPQRRTRQQQYQIRARQQSKKPPTHGRIKPAKVRGYWDTEWCVTDPMGWFIHDECDMFWYCDEDGNIYEDYCPPEAPIFDYEYLTCMSEEEGGWCWQWIDDGNWDGECPQDPGQLKFLPSEDCRNYYLCLNGQPEELFCAPGMHWNPVMEYCDTPANAQCDVSI